MDGEKDEWVADLYVSKNDQHATDQQACLILMYHTQT